MSDWILILFKNTPRKSLLAVSGLIGLSTILAGALSLPAAPALSQSSACHAPDSMKLPHIETPPASEEPRRTPIDGYLLTVSWSPQACKGNSNDPDMAMQCGSKAIGNFGFVLHGLWPETKGPDYPQWCRAESVLPKKLLAKNLCMTPSPQLLQHEWTKHGSCMVRHADSYFAAAKKLYDALHYPDMDALSRSDTTTAQDIAEAFAKANSGLDEKSIWVVTKDKLWLNELRICLGKDMHPRDCPAGNATKYRNERVKIWRAKA